jgi:succinate dehydrogenase / fumarate reductase cytochrome b subunit
MATQTTAGAAAGPAAKTAGRRPGFLSSSVGAKQGMAITGLLLVGFVIVHMLGNLQVFLGPEALNRYAQFLKGTPELLWTARLGLLVIFVLHVYLAFRVRQRNADARPIRYAVEKNLASTAASRTMFLTGLVVLAFVIYHLLHFTLGVVHQAPVLDESGRPTGEFVNYLELHDKTNRHDVYNMVISGFSNPWITLSYVVAQVILGFHLYHGASSMLQTLGLNHPRFNPILRKVGPVVAAVVVIGNSSMPLAVLLGLLKYQV